jgi:hypothetical protein
MSKSVAHLPVVPFSYEEVMSGALPALFARMAVEHGPILKHVVQSGPYAGEEFVYMVGPDANRCVCNTHRDHFSHHRGWAPIIGESLGKGRLFPT